MELYSSDYEKMVDIGSGSTWYSIYSTAVLMIPDEVKKNIPYAMEFLKTGECLAGNVKDTHSQLKVVYDFFATLPPGKAVYDWHKPEVAPPWAGNIASSVTSCANLYTTADDGNDLFMEVFSLLVYAERTNSSVIAM